MKWFFCASYICSGLFFKFYTSYIYQNNSFPFPITLSFYEQIIPFVLCNLVLERSKPYFAPSLVQIMAVFSLICAIDFCMENIALNMWSVSMNEIVRSLSPMFTALLQFSTVSRKRWGVLILLSIGVFLSVFESTEGFVWTGFFTSFTTVITSSLGAIISSYILTRFPYFSPIDVMLYSAMPVAVLLTIPMFYYEGYVFYQKMATHTFLSLTLIAIDTSVVFLNHFSYFRIIEYFGPVGTGIIDCVLVVTAIIYSEFFVSTVAFNPYRWLGILITIAVFCYDSVLDEE